MKANRQKRHGNTLLELIAATGIIAIALVPALRMMRDSLQISRKLEAANLMATLCVDKLEQHLAQASATWDISSDSGTYTALGYPTIRYQVTKSDLSLSGGISGRLMGVVVVVWDDANNDGSLSTGENSVTYATKVSKFSSYQYEAQGA